MLKKPMGVPRRHYLFRAKLTKFIWIIVCLGLAACNEPKTDATPKTNDDKPKTTTKNPEPKQTNTGGAGAGAGGAGAGAGGAGSSVQASITEHCEPESDYSLEIYVSTSPTSPTTILKMFPHAIAAINGPYNGTNNYEGHHFAWGEEFKGEKESSAKAFLSLDSQGNSEIETNFPSNSNLQNHQFVLSSTFSLVEDGAAESFSSTQSNNANRSAVGTKKIGTDTHICFATSNQATTNEDFAESLETKKYEHAISLSGSAQSELATRQKLFDSTTLTTNPTSIGSYMNFYMVPKERLSIDSVSEAIRESEETQFLDLAKASSYTATDSLQFMYPLDLDNPSELIAPVNRKTTLKNANPVALEIVISSYFGFRRIYNNTSAMHLGVDAHIYTPGSIPNIVAPADGKVIAIFDLDLHGVTALIDHGKYVSALCHLESFDSAKNQLNQVITKGTVISKMGQTGAVRGYHLHWAMIDKNSGQFVDPLIASKLMP
ncbi:MAG: M23 family metallopeptidase [Bdellovibrionales bacterium]|nr:M23 family metallopeptidase [Bdellovibrionales bacterium]